MDKSCSECKEPTLAQSLCTLCNKWLCYHCTDVHQHVRAPTTSQYADQHQQQRAGASHCPDLHQTGSSSLPPSSQVPGSYPCSLLMCHSHRQEPLELFCESCDLLCCSSCHLSSHKNHRVVQIEKALQDQQWLFESLMMQADERRAAVESNAKQIEDRLHAVKIAHRKAENQIKMAKMIVMNELNKRANLLIEQLEKISEGFQQRLEDQLQGAIEACGQLEHIQKFITWVTTDQCRGPVLFSRALISLHMQRLLEAPVHSEAWSPVKIKFNWDASYWTKQISSLGQLNVEGGSCSYPPGLPCSSILRPQPITCLALPSMFHRSRETSCGYQACCEPQICCLHSLSSQQALPSLDKPTVYTSSCVPPALFPASLQQSQQLQRSWDLEGSGPRPVSTSSLSTNGYNQLSYSQADASYSQASKSLVSHHQHQNEVFSDSQAQQCVDPARSNQRALTNIASQQEVHPPPVDRDVVAEESWEERCRREEECRGENTSTHLQLEGAAASEHQRSRAVLAPGDHRDGRRSTSLEVSLTAHECASDVQSCRLSLSSVCARRDRRSQSIPTELAAPRASTLNERPTRCTPSPEAGTADKCDILDQRQRRASDGVLCVVKEKSLNTALSRGHRSPLQAYKLEPDHPVIWNSKMTVHESQEKCRKASRNCQISNKAQKDSERAKVPVVCLERLKILVSQLPSHGRRTSDPLPTSGKLESDAFPQQRTWDSTTSNSTARGTESRETTCSFATSSYGEHQPCDQPILAPESVFDHHISRVINSSHKASMLPSADTNYVPQNHPELDVDSDFNPRSITEDGDDSQLNPQLESDTSADCEFNTLSSSEVEFEHMTEKTSAATRDSEPSLEYEAEPESDAAGASEDGQEIDVSAESAESDIHPQHDPGFQNRSDSEAASDHHPGSQSSSVESDLDAESELEPTTDEPQPLRSDLEDETQVGPAQRPILIANPEQDSAEMESEDFCAVCLIGGDLLCCDHCPKVFHLSCHIPPLLSFPSGDWVCSLCGDAEKPEYRCEKERKSKEQASVHELSACDQRKCERLTLLILCNILSAPFHEPVSPLARHYYQIIKRPMDLSVIRARLSKGNSRHYNSPDQFVSDVYLMFRNCAKFNYPDSEVAHAGRSLEQFFSSKLKEVYPNRVFPPAEADSDSDEYDEAYRMSEAGFLWPEQGEQCHRKRKRRQSLKSRRHHF
ncbi:tripartite motif-containing protein 66 isoform X2 [Gouania willdenowi]|nr:tripartite motif-containing protein 66-like isoform X2 [Gouania willdenowi]XP_028298126.1 tripartite motif-containing protein 66-like isoform X2 [Gouania willdenowi]